MFLCGKAPAHAAGGIGYIAGAGANAGLVVGPASRRAAATRTTVAMGRWVDSLRSLQAKVAAKVDYR